MCQRSIDRSVVKGAMLDIHYNVTVTLEIIKIRVNNWPTALARVV